MPLMLRKVLPEGRDQGVSRAFPEEDSDHGQIAMGIAVHEVSDHRRTAAVDRFFARLMEVELHQGEPNAADRQRAALVDVDL